MDIDFLILAAGLGTRMKSSTHKSFQKIAGKPIIRYIIDACKEISQKNIISIVNESIKNSDYFCDIKSVVQKSPLGTADAVMKAIPFLDSKYTIILCGDTPLIEKRHFLSLINNDSDASFIAMKIPCEFSNMPYGKVLFNEFGDFQKIVEFKDANEYEKLSNFANSGVYKIRTDLIKKYIYDIKQNHITGEYYLTDLLSIIKEKKIKVSAIKTDAYWPFHGINDMKDLSKAEDFIQSKLRNNFMKKGVILKDPKSVYFSHDTEIENDVTVEQNVVFKENVKIKNGSIIKSFSYIEDAEIMENSKIGPFARIRGNSLLSQNSDIGNFVEIKGSFIGNSSKIKHLSYIGDAKIGIKSNIGAGTIICNYDGVKKYKATIGDDVFIGSNSTLISPIEIENGSIVAAGSVITKNVPENSFAISRTNQETKLNKAKEIWKKKGRKNV